MLLINVGFSHIHDFSRKGKKNLFDGKNMYKITFFLF